MFLTVKIVGVRKNILNENLDNVKDKVNNVFAIITNIAWILLVVLLLTKGIF